MIILCGDVLIDFIPDKTVDGKDCYYPAPGGSCANIAVAIGRLGGKVGFMGGISNDFLGEKLMEFLETSNVETRYVARGPQQTTLAFVELGEEEPQYAFYDENTVSRLWVRSQSPGFTDDVNLIHIGSTSLIEPPISEACEQMFRIEKGKRILSIDPNCRPGNTLHPAVYRARMSRLIAMADIIKLSKSDLAFLMPDTSFDEAAEMWISQGTSIVIITRGSQGTLCYLPGQKAITVEPDYIDDVVDSIGAGDTFMAATLTYLQKEELLTLDKIKSITADQITQALKYGSVAAAMICQRRGANPPWEQEVAERIASKK
ncbi:Sugar or nucleoside kinase [Commensalibacter communis]|uniref:Ribokinase family (RbsK) n=1 Tax=Commensalibacter communis TaxID=2972786 RepID=A0A9W4X5U7_9PROT|nr:carbohydrate kinase [Commensalibacter communis]CAI3924951.1 Sugar or nucleoside kinase [Commensalibacter communis]CAI3924955.1 Sugar or nucleoside kinase [Commensalibacter communis]CAI3928363.1 Sugar or nucleoside kinase [Commensalibacter communis]CAI3929711.1 Sugar or nucleoside kinase [Commensalibacter communis]CAI3929870.1 Sugar or nucleoside kinase [Commensalibacter communis]